MIVKYAHPCNDEEVTQRFTVIEDRGDRLLVELVCDYAFKPTFCFASHHFVVAE